MAESSFSFEGDKEHIYRSFMPVFKELIRGESNKISVLANTAAALKEAFSFFWVGFYLVSDSTLELGPFQGTVACTKIAKGKGVCGTAWEKAEIQLVPDVAAFPGHIACSNLSKSEIVLPLLKNNQVVAVLDVDSDELNAFDATDVHYLNLICQCLSEYF